MFNGCKIYILISSLFLFFNTAIDYKCYGQTKTAFVTVRASEKYSPASALRIIFIGENYRKEWNEPVTVPVFDLAKVNGGFTIIDSGGGRQTNNLLKFCDCSFPFLLSQLIQPLGIHFPGFVTKLFNLGTIICETVHMW